MHLPSVPCLVGLALPLAKDLAGDPDLDLDLSLMGDVSPCRGS